LYFLSNIWSSAREGVEQGSRRGLKKRLSNTLRWNFTAERRASERAQDTLQKKMA